jgi:hypothetical protein
MIRTQLVVLIPPGVLRQIADAIERVAPPGPALQTVDITLDKAGATTLRFLNPACPAVANKLEAADAARAGDRQPEILIATPDVLRKITGG